MTFSFSLMAKIFFRRAGKYILRSYQAEDADAGVARTCSVEMATISFDPLQKMATSTKAQWTVLRIENRQR